MAMGVIPMAQPEGVAPSLPRTRAETPAERSAGETSAFGCVAPSARTVPLVESANTSRAWSMPKVAPSSTSTLVNEMKTAATPGEGAPAVPLSGSRMVSQRSPSGPSHGAENSDVPCWRARASVTSAPSAGSAAGSTAAPPAGPTPTMVTALRSRTATPRTSSSATAIEMPKRARAAASSVSVGAVVAAALTAGSAARTRSIPSECWSPARTASASVPLCAWTRTRTSRPALPMTAKTKASEMATGTMAMVSRARRSRRRTSASPLERLGAPVCFDLRGLGNFGKRRPPCGGDHRYGRALDHRVLARTSPRCGTLVRPSGRRTGGARVTRPEGTCRRDAERPTDS